MSLLWTGNTDRDASPPLPRKPQEWDEVCRTCKSFGLRKGIKECPVCGGDICDECRETSEVAKCDSCGAYLHNRDEIGAMCAADYRCGCGCGAVYCPALLCQAALVQHLAENAAEEHAGDYDDAHEGHRNGI